jgi:hypothetical protein
LKQAPDRELFSRSQEAVWATARKDLTPNLQSLTIEEKIHPIVVEELKKTPFNIFLPT